MKHKISTIIQARIGSSRFPGKILYNYNGKPSLQHLIESLKQVDYAPDFYLASTTDKNNDVLEFICRKNKIKLFRGDETNVASRFFKILSDAQPDYFIRINGDSPLFDYRIIQEGLKKLHTHPDMVTTVSENPFSSGMNMEIVKSKIFIENYSHFDKPEHFEHVTKYFYEHKELFNIAALNCPVKNASLYKFSFDTEEDRIRISEIFNALSLPHYHYTLAEKCKIYDSITTEIK